MIKPVMLQRRARRLFCTFLPILVRKQSGATSSDYWNSESSGQFHEMDPASEVMLYELLSVSRGKDTSFLDLGCNQGRHLNYLYEKGYRNLTGVDFSSLAIEKMQKQFPEMYQASKIINTSFQEYLTNDPAEVDIVYSRGATLEIVHPSFPIIKKICQMAKHYVVIVINEAGHAYPRFWEYEFARCGFELTHMRRPASMETPEHKVTLMTYRKLPS